MKFIKWFLSEAKYVYYIAITILIIMIIEAIRWSEELINDKPSLILFILIMGGFTTIMGVSLKREYGAVKSNL